MEDGKREGRRWPWELLLLTVIGFLAQWALDPTFMADDYPTIAYAGDVAHVAHDFVGPQYDLRFFLFYRPLITLSLAVDHELFGVDAAGFLFMNLLACVLSALLIYKIVRRLMPEGIGRQLAFGLSFLWLMHPVLLLSTQWVVGRVDTHVVFWILLAFWFHVGHRRGGPAWPVWLSLILAFMTKEYALGAPLLLLGLDMLDGHQVEEPGRRFAGRRLLALPTLLLIPAFLLLRKLLLGAALGGYGFLEGQSLQPFAILEGIWTTLGYSLLPVGPGWVRQLSLILVFGLLSLWVWRAGTERAGTGRAARLIGVLLISAGLFGPLAPLLPSMRDPGQQRYAYLAVLWPWAILILTYGPPKALRVLQALVLLGAVTSVIQGRSEGHRMMAGHADFVRSVVSVLHEADEAIGDSDSPLLLCGDTEQAFHPQRFLWGLGSVLKPPFWKGQREVLSLRKLHPFATEVKLEFLDEGLRGLVSIGPKGALPSPEAHWSPQPAPTLVAPQGFDGLLLPASIAELEAGERQGWPAREGYQGQVAVCTGFGSFLLPLPAEEGQIALVDLLLANVTFATPGMTNLALDLLWNGFDLAKQSPISLYWRNSNGLQRAELRVSPDFPAWYWGLHR